MAKQHTRNTGSLEMRHAEPGLHLKVRQRERPLTKMGLQASASSLEMRQGKETLSNLQVSVAMPVLKLHQINAHAKKTCENCTARGPILHGARKTTTMVHSNTVCTGNSSSQQGMFAFYQKTDGVWP